LICLCAYFVFAWQPDCPAFASILLLLALGLRDSSTVAVVIFVGHCSTLLVLAIMSVMWIVSREQHGFDVLLFNWAAMSTSSISSNLTRSIVVCLSSAMLGVTGFETSANYIEVCISRM
jgi:UPF0716 family protein affecting phage T7 exclusion